MTEHQKIAQVDQAVAVIAALPSHVATRLLSRLTPADVHRLLTAVGSKSCSHSTLLGHAVKRFEAEFSLARRSCSSSHSGDVNLFGNNSAVVVKETNVGKEQTSAASGIYGLCFLQDLAVDTRCRVLYSEAAGDIAIALAVLPTKTAAETLDSLDPALRSAVIECMAKSEEFEPEDVVQIRLVLMRNLNRIQTMDRHSSLTLSIARRRLPLDLLDVDWNATSRDVDTSKPAIANGQPPLLGMDRLSGLTEQDIRAVLQHTDTSLWAPALKNASSQIQQHVLGYMASEPARLLQIEIDQLSEVSQYDETNARNQIVASALKLASQGQVLTDGRSGKAAG